MSLNESIVEDATLEWLGELGYAVGHGSHLAPGGYAKGTLILALSQREKEEEREAIRRLNFSIPVVARAVIRNFRTAQLPTCMTTNP